MKSIQKLLVPTDLSENSRRGVALCVLPGRGKQRRFDYLTRRQRI